MQASEYQNQRDKFESELKKEIKKLQRYRDQVKTWQASSDVKDKKPLLEARRAVEREMERFKAAEREGKTKAFSKEGLIKAASLDPKAKAKQEVRDWMNSTVDKLNSQIDELEAELESSGSSRKKQKSSRTAEIEQFIQRHRDHIQKLESLLRLLDNEQLEPDDFEDIRDFLDDYIERNQDDPEEFEDSCEYFYEGVADVMESATVEVKSVTSLSKKKDQDKEEKKQKMLQEKEEQRQAQAEREREEREKVAKAKAMIAAEKNKTATYTVPKSVHASAKSAVVSSVGGDPSAMADKRGPQPSFHAMAQRGEQQGHGSVLHAVQDQVGKDGSHAANGGAPPKHHGGMGSWNYGGGGLGVGSAAGGFPHAARMAADQKDRQRERSDHLPSFPSNLPSFRHNIHSIPQEQDRTWRAQASRGKVTTVKALRDPSSYERFDGETLFFAFYYQPGTYNQYLAARALKKKNWRFNKRHNAWFQRLKEPQYVTPEHEQGSYIWFDYHMFHEDGTRGWRPRVKENFVFEYSDLEV